ncbi:synaptic vesicle glycoprotein 2B-like [Chironomus tepperi]|uniref:synaptic vesicle glycoprotein 2B-like n=1 Tax=Chironomus tepperi TaxID=113505 RepID=UPI00391F0ACE
MVFTISEHVNRDLNGISFTEAMKMAKFGKFQYFLILISGLFIGSTFFETMGINYVLPVAECDLGITSKSQYGLISGIWFAGIILTSHSWGFLSDAYGRKKMLMIASLSAFVASVLSSLAINLWQMMLFRLINGLCISGATSIVFAYLGEFLNDKNRSRSMMAASVIFGGCCLILPVLAWLIINQKWSFVIPIIQVTYKPWRFFLIVSGSLSLICGLSLFFLPESPKFTFSQGDEQRTLKILSKIYKINTGDNNYSVHKLKPNEEFGETGKGKNVFSQMGQQTSALFSNYTRSIIIVSVMQFGIYFVCNGMLLFFPHILNQTSKFLDENANATDTHICEIVETTIRVQREQQALQVEQICIDELAISAYYYTMILESCYVTGFLLISWMVNYTGRLVIFSFLFFTTSICGFTINYVGTTVGVYLYVWLLACGMNYTLLSTVTYDLFPTNLRSLAMSLSLMCGRLGSLVGGNIAGYLLEQYCDLTFTLSGVVLFCSGILTFLIPNIMKMK